MNRLTLEELHQQADPENLKYFTKWVKEFFRREVLRETGNLDQYEYSPEFGQAMRQEVSYWNPNRSKHAEVFWLENFVFSSDTSLRNKILNAMTVKFIGMPTLTLLATKSTDYANIIDFDEYGTNTDYRTYINQNLDSNPHKIKVWGATQLQTSLQTSARNFCRDTDNNQEQPFKLSNMIRWIEELDRLGMSAEVINKDNKLSNVCDWLKTHRGIGPYFAYHPPCNFSRSSELNHIDEDDDYCLVGPGAKRGLEFVFPSVKFKNDVIMENYILSIRDHQHDFFDFKNAEEKKFYVDNLERGGRLTTFGTEITFCQFACYDAIKNNEKAQIKRMLPLTFDSFVHIAEDLEKKMSVENLDNFF